MSETGLDLERRGFVGDVVSTAAAPIRAAKAVGSSALSASGEVMNGVRIASAQQKPLGEDIRALLENTLDFVGRVPGGKYPATLGWVLLDAFQKKPLSEDAILEKKQRAYEREFGIKPPKS